MTDKNTLSTPINNQYTYIVPQFVTPITQNRFIPIRYNDNSSIDFRTNNKATNTALFNNSKGDQNNTNTNNKRRIVVGHIKFIGPIFPLFSNIIDNNNNCDNFIMANNNINYVATLTNQSENTRSNLLEVHCVQDNLYNALANTPYINITTGLSFIADSINKLNTHQGVLPINTIHPVIQQQTALQQDGSNYHTWSVILSKKQMCVTATGQYLCYLKYKLLAVMTDAKKVNGIYPVNFTVREAIGYLKTYFQDGHAMKAIKK